MYAKVVVEVPSNSTDELFTYNVPDEFLDCIYIGSRVYVEFGFRNIMGYVINLTEEIDFTGELKDIIEVVDFEQGLNVEQLSLAKEISNETKSFYTSSLELMYPSFMKTKVRKYVNVINYDKVDGELALFFKLKKKVLITKEVLAKYNKIKKEIDKGNIEISSSIFTYGKNKTIKYYQVLNNDINVKSKKRHDILSFIKSTGEATNEEIKDYTGCSDLLLKKLVDEKYLKLINKAPILSESEEKFNKRIDYDFNGKQIKEKYNRLKKKPFLLYSNNESFKLDFYLDIAVDMIKENKQVIICTPSILVNSLIYKYFRSNLKGYKIFNFTSKLSNNDYYYNYNNVKAQNVDIVITTKSGIFLPLENIGLIIMIDEDNQNYINEQNPKFSTLEVLKYRSNYHNAKLLLTTSAASIDSYYHYYTAKYYLIQYIVDYSNQLNLINMRDELEDLMLSRLLKEKLEIKLKNNEISLLLLNNISHSSSVICEECSTIYKCPKCKVSVVYHKEKDIYRCPYCNLQIDNIECSKCHSHKFKMLGYGLEKLKERLLELYPTSRILQVDSVTMQKNSYDDFLLALEEKEVDIIIGTNILINIISDDIKLVGIINADTILNISDYRSAEIAFNTVSKVNNYPHAEVVIQGYNLEHYAIKAAVENNFEYFYNTEIDNRKMFEYPPFIEVNTLVIIGDYKDMYYFSNYFKKVFSRIITGACLGPVYIPKLRGVQIIIKHNDYIKLSQLIDEVTKKFKDKKLIVNFERYPKSF